MFFLSILLLIPALLNAEQTTPTIYTTTPIASSFSSSSPPSRTSEYVEAKSETASEKELPSSETTVLLPNLEMSATTLVEDDALPKNSYFDADSFHQFCKTVESNKPCISTKVNEKKETECCLCDYQITVTGKGSSATVKGASSENVPKNEDDKVTAATGDSCICVYTLDLPRTLSTTDKMKTGEPENFGGDSTTMESTDSATEFVTKTEEGHPEIYTTTTDIDASETGKVPAPSEKVQNHEETVASTTTDSACISAEKEKAHYDSDHASVVSCKYAIGNDDIKTTEIKTPETDSFAKPKECEPCPHPISASDLKDTGNSRTIKCKSRRVEPETIYQAPFTHTICESGCSTDEPTESTLEKNEENPKSVESPEIPQSKFKPRFICREQITSVHMMNQIESGCMHIPAGTENKLLPAVKKGDYVTTRALLNKLLEIFASTPNKDIDTSNYKEKFVDIALDLMGEPDFETRWIIQ